MSIKKAKACHKCSSIVLSKDEPCPVCKSNDQLSSNWGGLIIILNHEESQIARKVNVHRKGLYAIRVRQ